MVTMQYPDEIIITRKPGFSLDTNGDGQTTGSATTFTGKGRAEVAGANSTITGTDGEKISYSWIVYMPKTSEVFDFDDEVKVTKPDGSISEGTLKRQSNGQFNTRLWV